jgi:4-diphosphocytidyl-2C-methyl-D-erythritol kinase
MRLTRPSPCKVNLVLNILGRRPDGFHELETLFFPVPVTDLLEAEAIPTGVELTCSLPELKPDASTPRSRSSCSTNSTDNRWPSPTSIR